MKFADPIWLASSSPRRRSLLAEAGIAVRLQPPEIDDATLRPGNVRGEHWAMAMAYLKGRCVADQLARCGTPVTGTILAADTICIHRGKIFGQPRDAADARAMLKAMENDEHVTVTGVSLINLADSSRWLSVDCATVRFGIVGDESIDEYVASGQWRGKAGAYNLSERIEAGWPIQVVGDPTTVMGLPMRRLRGMLAPERLS